MVNNIITINDAFILPNFNMDALICKQISFTVSDIYKGTMHNHLVFTESFNQGDEYYDTNKKLIYLVLQLMTGDYCFDYYDEKGINIRDMDDVECSNNAMSAYNLYVHNIISKITEGELISWEADITFNKITNEILDIKNIRPDYTFK